MNEKKKQLIVVALVFALLLLIGGTYAYFSINATSDKTGAKVAGKANNLGNPTMQIKTSKLYLNLDANLMSQANAGKTYYANENESGLALETNPNYTLATAQLPEGDEVLDCTYNYKVTATVTTPITDNSDSDVKVIVGDKTMTLKELTTAGTNGIIVSGEIKNLTKGQSVSIPLTSSVTNTANTQDNLVGNSYTIKIEPYTSGDKKAFSCKLHEPGSVLAYNFVLAMPEKYSDLNETYHDLIRMPSAEKLGTRPDAITEEDITIYGVKTENITSSDIINTTENGIIYFPSNFETQNSFPSLFDALYTWYYNLTGGDFNQFECGFYTPYTINNTRYDGIYPNNLFGVRSEALDTDEITYWQGYKWIFYEVPLGSNFDVLNPDSQYRINFVTKEDTTLPIYQLINNVKLRGNYTYYGIYEYYEVYSE